MTSEGHWHNRKTPLGSAPDREPRRLFHVKQSPRQDDRRRFRERCRPQRRMFHVKQLRSSATRHPQTRNHASTAHQRPPTTSGVPPLGSTPLNHSRTSTPRTFPQSRTPAAPHAHTRSARRDLPPQSLAATHPRRPASPPPLPQPPREDPVPRREDPGEHEARGEHQDDRGTRGNVQ